MRKNELLRVCLAQHGVSYGADGTWPDDFWTCTTYCPVETGEMDATQNPHDKPSGSSTTYDLRSRAIVYTCAGITIDGN